MIKPTRTVNIGKQGIVPSEFIMYWRQYEAIHVPDPVLVAAARCLDLRPDLFTMTDVARKQLEDLVAYWKHFARPGHVLAALKDWNARVDKAEQEAKYNYLMNNQYGPMQ